MSESEAKQLATEIALELNWPWDETTLSARSWRIWPFSRVWQITSNVRKDGAIAKMRLNDRKRQMVFGRVNYPIREN